MASGFVGKAACFVKRITFGFFAVIGFLVCLLVALGIYAAYQHVEPPMPEPDKVILALDFTKGLEEKPDTTPFAFHAQGMVLRDVVRALERGAKDPRVTGVVAKFGPNLPAVAQSQEIRAALKSFRAAGKFAYAFATSFGEFGGGDRAYYLASGFGQIWLQPVGTLGITGLHAEVPFAKDILDKVGVRAAFMQREDYKNVMESLTRSEMSAPARDMTQWLLDDLSAQIRTGIAEGRGLEPEVVRDLINKGPYTADEALAAKLIDKIGYDDELEKLIADKAGADTPYIDPESYLSLNYDAPKPKATVALIYGTGMIVDGSSEDGFEDGMMWADDVAAALRDASEDDEVAAIVFRVDSPGGSPVASETIRRAIIKAKENGKKIIVSMGDVAGSGGYWIAMDADHIVADSATLTGSIGVVGGKYVTAELWKKIGVNWAMFNQNANSEMWSFLSDYTPQGQARADALLDDIYRTFTRNVAAARKIPPEKMPEIAKGRVFTGAQAVKLGLVDELGGLDTAFRATRLQIGLQADDPLMFKQFPAPESAADRLFHTVRRFLNAQIALAPLAADATALSSALQPVKAALRPMAAQMPVMVVE